MKPICLKELKWYSKENIQEALKIDIALVENILSELIQNRIVKVNNGGYQFNYVGVIICKNTPIICIPKYVSNVCTDIDIALIINLLRQYSNRETLINEELETLGDGLKNESSKLALAIFLLEDYYKNHLYSNDISVKCVNGDGEIDWDTTISESQVYINDNRPIYFELITNSNVNDESNFYRNLHIKVLKECSDYLFGSGLGYYLDLNEFNMEEIIDISMTREEIIYRLDQELHIQYDDVKRNTLIGIKNYFLNTATKDGFTIDFFGTRLFHNVWEKVCGFNLNNQYDEYKKYIQKPTWDFGTKKYRSDRLIPDIICVKDNEFIIADAKYYNIKFEESLINNPGIGDVTKQYLYQLALQEIIVEQGYPSVKNILLFPSELGELKKIGNVSLSFLSNIGLENIDLYYVPASQFYNNYIRADKKCNIFL